MDDQKKTNFPMGDHMMRSKTIDNSRSPLQQNKSAFQKNLMNTSNLLNSSALTTINERV